MAFFFMADMNGGDPITTYDTLGAHPPSTPGENTPLAMLPGKAHPNSLDNCRMEFARWIDSEANREEGGEPCEVVIRFDMFGVGW